MLRTILSLIAGLVVWGLLKLAGLWHFGLQSYPLWADPSAILASGILVGCAAGRRGLILGGVIGLVDLSLLLGLLYAMSDLSHFGRGGLFWLLVQGIGFSILPGVLGGYLGERIVRFRHRRIKPSDHEVRGLHSLD